MTRNRLAYFLLASLTIIFGLLSRKINFLPLATGDALYAIMVYWGCRFLLVQTPLYCSVVLSIVFCLGIEFLQLVQHPILIEWRNDPLLRLVFGQGFLWTDLLAYCVGAILANFIDRKFLSFMLKRK